TVKVLRGEFKGIEGKITHVSTEKRGIAIEGIKREKLKGGNVDIYIHPSNVVITALNLEDKWRQNRLEGQKTKTPRSSQPDEQKETEKLEKTVKPGDHKKNLSIPTAVFIRDTLKLVNTLREAKSVIYDGKIKVDGVVRKSIHHGVGLMDVVEMEGMPDIYRLVPKDLTVLKPIKINESEKTKKLLKVSRKVTIKEKKTQLGFQYSRKII